MSCGTARGGIHRNFIKNQQKFTFTILISPQNINIIIRCMKESAVRQAGDAPVAAQTGNLEKGLRGMRRIK